MLSLCNVLLLFCVSLKHAASAEFSADVSIVTSQQLPVSAEQEFMSRSEKCPPYSLTLT